jgi:hypothetical protein
MVRLSSDCSPPFFPLKRDGEFVSAYVLQTGDIATAPRFVLAKSFPAAFMRETSISAANHIMCSMKLLRINTRAMAMPLPG